METGKPVGSHVPPLGDGWHDLPGGGAVKMKGGFPVQVTDKGHWNLDENGILAEAARKTGMKLTWGTQDRTKRWRRGSTLKLFLGFDVWRWSFATVLLAPCEECGNDAGIKWVEVPGGPPWWICERCYQKVLSGQHDD